MPLRSTHRFECTTRFVVSGVLRCWNTLSWSVPKRSTYETTSTLANAHVNRHEDCICCWFNQDPPLRPGRSWFSATVVVPLRRLGHFDYYNLQIQQEVGSGSQLQQNSRLRLSTTRNHTGQLLPQLRVFRETSIQGR
jgi:hypothetical protein